MLTKKQEGVPCLVCAGNGRTVCYGAYPECWVCEGIGMVDTAKGLRQSAIMAAGKGQWDESWRTRVNS